MFTCAMCTALACMSGDKSKMPKNCPMRDQEFFDKLPAEYRQPENHDFFVTSSLIEALGYGQWPRLREVAEFARRMGYKKLGIAFCLGLQKEARIVHQLLMKQGFEVVSVICKTGGLSKKEMDITEEAMGKGKENFTCTAFQKELLGEPTCNPIAQARLLNQEKTDFNICLGLCVGHDSLFYKYSDAPVTTLVAKDRVTGHNPVAAIYCADGYFDGRNTIQED